MDVDYLNSLLETFTALPSETEWLEFKHNNDNPHKIGEYISALSNSAALNNKQFGYIVWGIQDRTHEIVGTQFRPKQAKVGAQELENWLKIKLQPRIDFKICEFEYRDQNIVLFEIPRATYIPVKFDSIEYIRVGTYKKQLGEHPEKERQLWSILSNNPTNSSLRKRFSIESKNSSMASRIITDTINANLIKAQDPNSNSRKYIPFWA